eukprot:gene16432-22646_t
MSNEIEGVKAMVAQFVTFLEIMSVPLLFAIVTFTEDSHGCYVSLNEFTSFQDTLAFVGSIMLCQPPDQPSVSASGGDEDENQKAALHRLVDLDPLPTVGFLITDALPHMGANNMQGSTARKELSWLQNRGVDSETARDFFRVLGLVKKHFQDLLVMNCVIYNHVPESNVYGSVAQETGGMLMIPRSRTADVLAEGMLQVVKTVLNQLEGVSSDKVTELAGFDLFDLSGLSHREREADPAGLMSLGDNSTIFQIAMERTVEVCGHKWSKRAVGMSEPADQLEFVWQAARYIVLRGDPTIPVETTDADLASLLALHERITSKLKPEVRGHFSFGEADIEHLAELAASARLASAVESPTTSVISLETVGDALADDADWEDWLATVMRILMGFPMKLQLPLDRNGAPDFADAWSAVSLALGCDKMSSADFLRMLGDSPTAVGPTDREEHNAFLLTAEPKDSLASLVFKVASGTQVLNYITGILMGAKGFLPNLHSGITSSSLVRLVHSESALTEFQWGQAEQLVHTLRLIHRCPAKSLAQKLKHEGLANPADPLSKLVAVAARLAPGTDQQKSVLQLVLQEWVAIMLQKHYGKQTLENDEKYIDSLMQYIPLEALLPGSEREIQPTSELHVLELEEQAIVKKLATGWEEACLQRLHHGVPGSDVPPHRVMAHFEQAANRLLRLLMPTEGAGAVEVSTVWPQWQVGVLQAILLRYRGARYKCLGPVDGPLSELGWERVEVPSLGALVVERMQQAAAKKLQSYRQARLAHATECLLSAAAAAVVSAGSEDGVVEVLQGMYIETSGVHARQTRPGQLPIGPVARVVDVVGRLDRSNVPHILERLGDKPLKQEVLRGLVLGGWTTLPPQALRGSSVVWNACTAYPDMLDVLMSASKCARTSGCNRHGHSAELNYPGPCGWRLEYQEQRLVNVPFELVKAYLTQMQRFTEMSKMAQSMCGVTEKADEVEAVLREYQDANRLGHAQGQVEAILGCELSAAE